MSVFMYSICRFMFVGFFASGWFVLTPRLVRRLAACFLYLIFCLQGRHRGRRSGRLPRDGQDGGQRPQVHQGGWFFKFEFVLRSFLATVGRDDGYWLRLVEATALLGAPVHPFRVAPTFR